MERTDKNRIDPRKRRIYTHGRGKENKKRKD